jgi:hypothetical protein
MNRVSAKVYNIVDIESDLLGHVGGENTMSDVILVRVMAFDKIALLGDSVSSNYNVLRYFESNFFFLLVAAETPDADVLRNGNGHYRSTRHVNARIARGSGRRCGWCSHREQQATENHAEEKLNQEFLPFPLNDTPRFIDGPRTRMQRSAGAQSGHERSQPSAIICRSLPALLGERINQVAGSDEAQHGHN